MGQARLVITPTDRCSWAWNPRRAQRPARRSACGGPTCTCSTTRECRGGEVAAGDPLVLHTWRGTFCPKEQTFFRQVLLPLQDEADVAYKGIASLSVEPPELSFAFRAGLGARWALLCDPHRTTLSEVALAESTDEVHHPYAPYAWVLLPDLTVTAAWNGYWYGGRPTRRRAADRLAQRPARPAQRHLAGPPRRWLVTSWVWLVRMHPDDGFQARTSEHGPPLIARATLSWPDGRREILAACPAGSPAGANRATRRRRPDRSEGTRHLRGGAVAQGGPGAAVRRPVGAARAPAAGGLAGWAGHPGKALEVQRCPETPVNCVSRHHTGRADRI